jgi:Holliday junction resolvasome RuvABC endonuclease subunit
MSVMDVLKLLWRDMRMEQREGVFHIAENTGILKYKFFQASIPVDVITPSEIKKKATGNGNASKHDMHKAFSRETGYNLLSIMTPLKKEVTNPVSDIIDSYYVCKTTVD